jgi:hypothetical protein
MPSEALAMSKWSWPVRDCGIIQRSSANKNQMRSSFGLAEQRCSASLAEAPMHYVVAIGDAAIGTRQPLEGKGCSWEANVDRTTSCSEVLAYSTPAYARDNGIRSSPISDVSAQTSAGNSHRHF